MSRAEYWLDILIAGAMPLMGLRLMHAARRSEAAVLFVALGLFMSLAWARLDAPDIALVEAGLGAGLMGTLLMGAVGWAPGEDRPPRKGLSKKRVLLGALCGALASGLAWTVLLLPARQPGLGAEVRANLPQSGAAHAVTAVLLSFRGYDTLLEVAVLLVAALGVRTLYPIPASYMIGLGAPQPLLTGVVHVLVPGCILIAGVLLYRGSHAPGGAFQAATLLSGAGVLLLLAQQIRVPSLSSPAVRALLLVGPFTFVSAAAAGALSGEAMLSYPHGHAGALIVFIETALTFSIALILVMFLGRPDPVDEEREAPRGGGAP
jgi:multisubunit Na+/H+ antiporter MnhB subunit